MRARGANGVDAASPRGGRDWQEAYARLDRAERALTRAELPAEQVDLALRERARALARSASGPAVPGRDVLVFGCGGGPYGIDAAHAREILPLSSLTPVPRAAPFVAGVIHRRGEILMLVDVATLMGLAPHGVADRTKVVVVGAPAREIGLVAESVEGIRGVATAAITPALSEAPFVEGVADGSVVLLEIEALLSAVGMTAASRP